MPVEEIKLYLFELTDEIDLNKLDLSFLNGSKELSVISSVIKKREFILSRYLLYQLLFRNWGIEYKEFIKDTSGKPLLTSGQLNLSLSHSRNCFFFGFSPRTAAIGVDVEVKTTKKDPLVLAKKYFSPFEYNQLRAIKNKTDLELQFRDLWSLKEAYYKSISSEKALSEVKKVKFDLSQKIVFLDQKEKDLKDMSFFWRKEERMSLAVSLKGLMIQNAKVYIFKNLQFQDYEVVNMSSLKLSRENI